MARPYKQKHKDKDGNVVEGKYWWIKYHRNGKAFYESTKSTSYTVAKNLLAKREGEKVEGKLPGVNFEKTTFEDLAKDYTHDYELNGKKSVVKAKECVEHLKGFFENMRATNITTSKINDFIAARLEEGASNATINRDLSALKRMFHLGMQYTPPKVQMVPYITKLSENNVRKGFLEHAEYMALLKTLPEYLRGIVILGYKRGLRKGEIMNLRWDQVDLEAATIRLSGEMTKSGEPRTIPLDEELVSMLKGQREAQKTREKISHHVFTYENGEPIKDFRGTWDAACKDANIEGRLFHDLRRTAVRNMVRAGVPEVIAMAISGHKTRSIFDRYNIVNEEDLKAASDSITNHLKVLETSSKKKVVDMPKKMSSTKKGDMEAAL